MAKLYNFAITKKKLVKFYLILIKSDFSIHVRNN